MRGLLALPWVAFAFASAASPAWSGQDPGQEQHRDPAEFAPEEYSALEELTDIAEEVRAEIEAIRGKKFLEAVELRLADSESLEACLARRVGRVRSEEDQRSLELTAKLLGMVPGDLDLARMLGDVWTDSLPGFYDPESGTLFLRDTLTPSAAREVIAHELTHALDDQYYDFTTTHERLRGNSDALMAHYAVIEGSGLTGLAEWRARNDESARVRERLTRPATFLSALLDAAPPFVWKPLLAIYARGESFLRRTNAQSLGVETARATDVERAFDDLPRSTEQILHPVKYWKPGRVDEPCEVEFDPSNVSRDWQVLREDTLGELYLAVLTQPFEERSAAASLTPFDMLGLHCTTDAASGWGGDRYVLLEGHCGYVLHLETVWDSHADAREFADAVGELRPHIIAEMNRTPGSSGEPNGLRVELGPESDRVRVTSWFDVSEDEALAVRDALVVSIER